MTSLQFLGGKRRPPFHGVAVYAFLTIARIHAGVLDDTSAPAKPITPPPASQTTGATTSDASPATLKPQPAQPSSTPSIPQTNELKSVLSVGVNGNDPYDKLALALAQSSGSDSKLYVSIGNFLDGDTDELSPRSTEVKEELAIALPKTGKFEIITREHLADIQNEGKFQSSDIVQPSAGSKQVGVKAVNGIIRGRISSKSPDIIVYAEIAYLNGGEIRKVKAVIPSTIADPSRKNHAGAALQLSQTDNPSDQQDGKRGKQRQGNKNGAASAEPKPEGKKNPKAQQSEHPLVNKINQREQRLENQLKHGVANGVIKPKEAAEIREGIQKIKRQENRFLLQNDGFLTKSERHQLNREEDQLAQLIRKDKKANRRN